MRWASGLLVLVVAMAIVLHLSARSTKKTLDTVAHGVTELREDVPPQPFDAQAATALRDRLSELVDSPSLPGEDLAAAAATAASWAAACVPGSAEYHAAVKLRSAAVELGAAGPDLSDPHRTAARRALAEAAAAISGPAVPSGAVGGIRDQLENLQRSQQQRSQEVDRELR